MKRFIAVILSVLLFVSLVGCNNTAKVPIENYDWSMATIQSTENNGAFIVYDPDIVIDPEYTYSHCAPMKMTCEAKDGKITISDKTNNKTYEGTYKVTDKSPESTIYEITIGEKEGTAVTAMTKYPNGTGMATLIISVDGYSLNFQTGNILALD